ncbi:hypothetical protein BZG36_02948 [Bifiguratus adelaidae]|uniref:Chromatin modification-related protein EAF6 n=1 Tax=Bifiguratus adelaidae TaxID=1938954 RepID=A0A261Y028_9FUNG|nr:hypothetical protein BZG36_02948 [Bifiguratus adelaidae]
MPEAVENTAPLQSLSSGLREAKTVTRQQYEEAKAELQLLLSRKKQVDINLANLEANIYAFEGSYLEDTQQYGNIIKGFDGYLTNKTDKKRQKYTDADRLFSMSSTTYMKLASPSPANRALNGLPATTPFWVNLAPGGSRPYQSTEKLNITPRLLHLWFRLRRCISATYPKSVFESRDELVITMEEDLIKMIRGKGRAKNRKMTEAHKPLLRSYLRYKLTPVLFVALAAITGIDPKYIREYMEAKLRSRKMTPVKKRRRIEDHLADGLDSNSRLNDIFYTWNKLEQIRNDLSVWDDQVAKEKTIVDIKLDTDAFQELWDARIRCVNDPPFRVFNEVDDEDLPILEYREEHKIHMDVVISQKNRCCRCVGECRSNPVQVTDLFTTDLNLLEYISQLSQCGPDCECSGRCQGRIYQRLHKRFGSYRRQLELFKTRSKGWAVRANSAIPAGSYIGEYIGELLSEEECIRRDNLKVEAEYMYFFQVNSGDTDARGDRLTIDATYYCNLTRFLNHSCDGGNVCKPITFTGSDGVPHLLFFTSRNVSIGEELTFDYNVLTKVSGHKCHCGSKECRGFFD